MLSVVVIGTGNVARQLSRAWHHDTGVEVMQVIGRTQSETRYLEGHRITTFENMSSKADCYIIAVSDDAITSVSQNFKQLNKLVVHTSGSTPMDALLPHERRGVLYPLQTFSAGREVDLSNVPMFLEFNSSNDKDVILQLAQSLSKQSYWLNSAKRKHLHLAAVFLNNFTNHLLHLSEENCKELEMDPQILRPLLHETISKAMSMGPYRAQTGPARRGDKAVIETHLNMIEDRNQQEIYKIISQSILSTYENELQKLA